MTWTSWKGVLALAVVASITANTAHAFMTAPPAYAVGAALWAAVPPTFLFWVTHNLAAERGGSARRWMMRLGIAGAIAIAGMAFAVSFMSMRDLSILLGCPPAVAALTPLLIDATIAVASVFLVRETAEAAHVTQSAPTIPVHAPAPVHQELVHAEASTEHVVQGAEQVVRDMVHAEAQAPLNSEDGVVQADERVAQDLERLHLVTTPLDGVVEQTLTAAPQPPEAVHRVVEHAAGSAPVLPMHDAEAERLRECGVTQLPAPAVASIVALDDAGVSRNKIAEAVPAAPRTVSKVLAARGAPPV